VTGVTGATLTFKDAVGAWCNAPILHEITAVVAGNDGSKKMARYEILQNDYSSFAELFDPIVRTTGWNGSVISDENIDISCANGVFTVAHNENQTVSRITIIDKYTVLGANINKAFNV
jgi:hypothetical protein